MSGYVTAPMRFLRWYESTTSGVRECGRLARADGVTAGNLAITIRTVWNDDSTTEVWGESVLADTAFSAEILQDLETYFAGTSVDWPPTICQPPFRLTHTSVKRRAPLTYPLADPVRVERPVTTATSP